MARTTACAAPHPRRPRTAAAVRPARESSRAERAPQSLTRAVPDPRRLFYRHGHVRQKHPQLSALSRPPAHTTPRTLAKGGACQCQCEGTIRGRTRGAPCTRAGGQDGPLPGRLAPAGGRARHGRRRRRRGVGGTWCRSGAAGPPACSRARCRAGPAPARADTHNQTHADNTHRDTVRQRQKEHPHPPVSTWRHATRHSLGAE